MDAVSIRISGTQSFFQHFSFKIFISFIFYTLLLEQTCEISTWSFKEGLKNTLVSLLFSCIFKSHFCFPLTIQHCLHVETYESYEEQQSLLLEEDEMVNHPHFSNVDMS